AEFESLEDAQQWAAQDPYRIDGVVMNVQVTPFLQILPWASIEFLRSGLASTPPFPLTSSRSRMRAVCSSGIPVLATAEGTFAFTSCHSVSQVRVLSNDIGWCTKRWET